MYNLNGDYDKAIELLKDHHFRTWEGGRDIYFHYVDAHTLSALQLMEEGRQELAVEALEKAMEYPENLEVGKPLDDERNAMIWYFMGQAYNQLGKKKKAQEYYLKSTEARNSRSWPDLPYYQARAYEALGETAKAWEIYQQLITEGDRQLARGRMGTGIGVEEETGNANRAISEAYYLKALGSMGLDAAEDAKAFFEESLETYRNNLWARFHINSQP